MKAFIDSIKARAAQAKATIAKSDTLALLDAAVRESKAEYDRQGSAPNTKRSEAHAAWTIASQAAQLARQVIADAEAVLKECNPYLTAHADLAGAHTTYTKAQAFKSAAVSDITNLERLIAELNGEISELSDKAKEALTVHGQTSIAARLTGQQAPPTPKLITTLSTDLESRKATLESAETMLSTAQARRDQANESAKESSNLWRYARLRVATIEHQDALASIAPQLTMYLAALHGVSSYQNKIQFEPERAAINTASELLNAELERVN